MFYAGIDAHVKSSTICVVDGKGQTVHRCEVLTSGEGFRAGLKRWAQRGLTAAVEASGITPWVAPLLQAMQVKVVVANPNRVRLIAESRKKSNRVDAATLAELLRLGGLPEVHQASPAARRLRTELAVRRQFVRQRTALVNQARGLLRGWGVNLPARFLGRRASWKQLAARRVPAYVRTLLRTMEAVYEQLTCAIRELGAGLEAAARKDARVEKLRTMPGVGPLSALTLVSAVDTIARFERAKQLTSYCGIVPTVRSTGEREQQGSITRQGRSEVRALWVQAAHAVVRSRQPAACALQRWFWKVARRRGVRTAIVALARKMLSVAFYLLRDGTQYDPLRWKRASLPIRQAIA
jgi:transposase